MENLYAYLRRAYSTGSLQLMGLGPVASTIRSHFTVAEINAGAILVPAFGLGFKPRLINVKVMAIGGAVAGAAGIDIKGTSAGAPKTLVAIATAALTSGAVLRDGAANVVVLADGTSYTAMDQNTPITIIKNGADITGATHIDVIADFALDKIG